MVYMHDHFFLLNNTMASSLRTFEDTYLLLPRHLHAPGFCLCLLKVLLTQDQSTPKRGGCINLSRETSLTLGGPNTETPFIYAYLALSLELLSATPTMPWLLEVHWPGL